MNALPTSIDQVSDAVTGEVIGCAHVAKCLVHQRTTAFRIVPKEVVYCEQCYNAEVV